MAYKLRDREFPPRSAAWNNSRAHQRHQLLRDSTEGQSARADAKEPNWLGYPSSMSATASVSQRSVAGGHLYFGLAPTVAEVLREPLAILEQRSIAREFNERLEYKDMLLRDQAHRFANSLQIVASTLLAKSRSARTEEARNELQNAHHRIMSLAAVQQQLQAPATDERIDLHSYLSGLCKALAESAIGDEHPITLQAQVDAGPVDADLAVSLYRIATELIINALKHAFPDSQAGCAVTVTFEQAGPNWRLAVSDNGTGKEGRNSNKNASGIGTKIVDALAKHIDGTVEIHKGPNGRTVSITHGVFVTQTSSAAALIPA